VQSGQIELQLDRMWVPIDYNKVVREQFSPDGRYYACWRDLNFPYCFICHQEAEAAQNGCSLVLRQEWQDNVRWLPACRHFDAHAPVSF
jgi:hypothetical protein